MKRWVVLLVAMLACAALAWGNPYSAAWPLQCPLYRLTGWQCPLCGGQRAVHELLHGHLWAALRLNPAMWVVAPWAILWAGAQLSDRIAATRWGRWAMRDEVVWTVVAVLLAWGVVRNVWL